MKHVLTAKEYQFLLNYAIESEVSFTTNYSGRSMYGKTCIGFVCSEPINFVANLIAEFFDSGSNDEFPELLDAFLSCCATTDSMGRSSTIVYYMSITAPAEFQSYSPEEFDDE